LQREPPSIARAFPEKNVAVFLRTLKGKAP
jgi:hypothetical protein